VPLTGEEIRVRLVALAEKWSLYTGSERAEAHTFLSELFNCYDQRRDAVAAFEEPQAGGFIDLVWPRVCIIEMKRPSEASRLDRHREQAFRYWREAADPERGVPAPRYVVLCAFTRFEVWEPGGYPQAPRAEFDLIELPDRYETLLFLAGREPVFIGGHEAITREAVGNLTELYRRLRERHAADADVLREFCLQSVWCMFAEDLGLIEAQLFTRLVGRLIEDPQRSSFDEIGQLFCYLNTPGGGPDHGLYAGVRYANGGLFENPARVHLDQEELELLRVACQSDWTRVQPSIFGSLLEGGLGHDMQWALGAHYTHEADIRKVVGPSIVEPWEERIATISTHAEVVQAQNDLANYVVLDPACGSGNFLYVAYQELRRIESKLRERERELRRDAGMPDQQALSFFPLSNIRGIEVNGYAVAVARVTLWMGHKIAVDREGLDEATLPLADLSGIVRADALRVPWPACDVIVGNPPFHGDRNMRKLLGDAYLAWLEREFNIGIKDYCVYWFRRAHDHLEGGQRAGLVGTNSISQNRARSESLRYIVEHEGVIVDAVSSQDWPGEAAVDVSIVNWVKRPAAQDSVRLDGHELTEPISPSLRPMSLAVDTAQRLAANEGKAFYGPIPGGRGFILNPDEAQDLIDRHGESWREIIRPYLTGEDLLRRPGHEPSRWIIDFGFRPLEGAALFDEALSIVRERVKPQRDRVRRRAYRENWWRFSEPIRGMREALDGLPRYIAGPAQGKRILFTWVDAAVCPSNLVTAFAFDDDYSMGVLASSVHAQWALAQASTLEDRTRYTTTSTFDTFPWPTPTDVQRKEVGSAAKRLIDERDLLSMEHGLGLTELYNLVEDGGFRLLRELQSRLDEAVARAYGWPTSVAADPDACNAELLRLNRLVSAGGLAYFGPSGRS
jgi:hypothetical protein